MIRVRDGTDWYQVDGNCIHDAAQSEEWSESPDVDADRNQRMNAMPSSRHVGFRLRLDLKGTREGEGWGGMGC